VASNQLALLANDGELMVRSSGKMSFESASSDIAIRTLTGKISVLGMKTIVTGETITSIESGAAINVIAAGGLNMAAGAEASLYAAGTVGVVAGLEVGLYGHGVGIVGPSGISLDSGTSIGMLSPSVVSEGIILMNTVPPIVVHSSSCAAFTTNTSIT
jgi:hypothetical protein